MLTAEEQSILTRTFLFYGCSAADMDRTLPLCDWNIRTFGKGSTIYSPGDFHKELGILLKGRVRVSKGGLVVSELSSGDLFGAAALFNDEPDYVSTLTARNKCRILFFSQDAVQQLIDKNGTVRQNYIRYLSGRIRFLSDKIDTLIQGSGERKLSSFLLSLCNEQGQVHLPCSMTELAARLNIGRASLYREMQKLEEAGILHREGKTIVIQQQELLSRL